MDQIAPPCIGTVKLSATPPNYAGLIQPLLHLRPEFTKSDEASCQEFTLEEELDGVCDAPPNIREVLRRELVAREVKWQKLLWETANGKRILAEMEGQRLSRAKHRPTISQLLLPTNTTYTGDAKFSNVIEGDSFELPGKRNILQSVTENKPFPDTTDAYESNAPSLKTHPSIFATASAPCRSVLIQNIPTNFTVHMLLSSVYGGVVELVRLIPQISALGEGQSAFVKFTSATAAKAYSSATARQPYLRVVLLPTATYGTERDVHAEANEGGACPNNQTRCLVVEQFPQDLLYKLSKQIHLEVRDFPSTIGSIEEVWLENDRLHLSFVSIRQAVRVFQELQVFFFGKVSQKVRFEKDPCNRRVCSGSPAGGTGGGPTGKVSSHGHIGLKSLIETVGLATFEHVYKNIVFTSNISTAAANMESVETEMNMR